MPDKSELIHYKKLFEKELFNILSYWTNYAQDKDGIGCRYLLISSSRPGTRNSYNQIVVVN